MKVAVFGSGTMGAGIAELFASHEHTVLLYASSVPSAQKHREKLNARLDSRVARGKLTHRKKQSIMEHIFVEEKTSAADVDLVLETIKEDMAVKRDLLFELDGLCKPGTVFATNTSALSITEMSLGLSHPLIGMHFFFPVTAMKLVEIICGAHTPQTAFDFVKELAEQDCPIYMGRIDYCYLKGMKTGNHLNAVEELSRQEGFPAEQLARQGLENQGRRYSVARIFPALLVDNGSIIRLGDLEVQCIHTPGHTPGHMVLYLPKEQLLFSGDHVLFDITPNIAVWHGVPHSLEDYLSSLEKIRSIPIKATFPAHRHGESDVYQRIDALQAHHRERLEEIRQAVENHPETTAYQIAGLISWSARGLGWEQFPPHQKWFAMGETLAHLRYLQDHKQVLRNERSELVCYAPIDFAW